MGRETETDAELIAACRRGETAALGVIVERYQRAVCAVAYSAVRDRVLAEDIAQDTFVMAWSKLGSLRDSERLPAWLCGIARNLARTQRRRGRREEPAIDIERVATGDHIVGATPHEQLDERQTEAVLADALERVPEKYREPLVLFYCEEKSAQEVARLLGMTDQAVHQRLTRGRQHLASDAQLFEQAVGHTVRPRRDLAAAVVAAIAIGVGSSSRVEASTTRPRGTKSMLKIGATVIAVAGLATTTAYVASRASATPGASPRSSDVQTASQVTPTPASAVASAPQAPSLRGPVDPWQPAASPSLTPVSPACAHSAGHLADLMMSNSMLGEQDVPLLAPLMRNNLEQECAEQAWSADYMTCIDGASDMFSMMFDCKKLAPAKEQSGQRVPTQSPPTFAPEPNDDCASVGRHLATIMHRSNPHDFPEEIAAEKEPDARTRDDKTRAAIREMAESACTSAPWTQARRHCIATATTVRALDTCE
jgi:RNA polymerase sigma factor (sigma-70 family)